MKKPFDFEAFKRGAEALTRDGKVATFRAHCPDRGTYRRVIYTTPVMAVTLATEDGQPPVEVSEAGRYAHNTDMRDLVSMAEDIGPKLVPLGPQNVPPGSAVKRQIDGCGWDLVLAVDGLGVTTRDKRLSYEELQSWHIKAPAASADWRKAEKQEELK